ncbi:MAG: ABC transporter permease subunit [Proteobacteria bacterium]|nr:ABC transporter permease subunit [Pseudomonadota bacterium]
MALSARIPGLVPWIVPAIIIALWQAGASLGLIKAEFLPAPSEVLAAGYRLTLSGELPENIAISFKRAISGFLVGGTLAFGFGLANGLSRTTEKLTDSTFQMVRNIPNLALVPLVILWFGIDEGAKLFLTAFGVFFPIYINTFHGVRNVDPQLIEMARSYGIGPFNLFRKVVLPGALPSIFVGLRYALGIMWLTLIVSETIAATSGIGYMAMHAREFMLVDIVVLAIVVYALLGKLADSAARWLERRTLAWNPAYHKI